MIDKKYNVIYADPPWRYNQKQVGRGNASGAIGQYKTLPLSEIKALPVDSITQDNSVCFIWATVPLLDHAFEVMAAWGFKYKSLIVWEKTGGLGMGNWVRIQTELLIFGIKGTVTPFANQHKNIYRHPLCDHSAKPHFFRELVMKLPKFETHTRLELFARSRSGMWPDYEYEGWDVYGNEVNNSIKLPQ